MGQGVRKWDWKWREVRQFFEMSLRKALESHQTWVFIDALDEYGEDDANELIDTFNSWIQASPAKAQFHICFTCRHYPPLTCPEGVVEIRLEEENRDDISTYVQSQLSAWSHDKNMATIWMDITDRASGVFMWARLIVPRVLRLECRGENWRRIKREIENTPQELGDTYRNLMQNVETDPNSLKLIQWICFAMEPLTLDELRWAMIVDPEYSDEPASLQHYENAEAFATDCEMMEKKLKALSCGLAEALPSSRVVQFIHQSVKDFFIREGLAIMHKIQNRASAEAEEVVLEGIAHDQLSRTCVRYFSAQEIMQMQPTMPGGKLVSRFPLLRYATAHWKAHVQQSEKEITRTDLPRYFGWPSEHVMQLLATFDASEMNARPWCPPNHTTLLHVASRHRLVGPLLGILQSEEPLDNKIDASDEDMRTPLSWAAEEGHETVVRLLLDRGANVNAQCDVGGPALLAASWRGHEQIVRMLLDHGAYVHAQNILQCDALQLASLYGKEKIARLLLEYGADVNAWCAGVRQNPFTASEYGGFEHVARLLHETVADVNVEGGSSKTALQAALFGRHRKAVEEVLEKGTDVSDGRTGKALVSASSQGHEQIVRMLLEKGGDVYAQARLFDYVTALDMALGSGHQKTVQVLLEYIATQ